MPSLEFPLLPMTDLEVMVRQEEDLDPDCLLVTTGAGLSLSGRKVRPVSRGSGWAHLARRDTSAALAPSKRAHQAQSAPGPLLPPYSPTRARPCYVFQSSPALLSPLPRGHNHIVPNAVIAVRMRMPNPIRSTQSKIGTARPPML